MGRSRAAPAGRDDGSVAFDDGPRAGGGAGVTHSAGCVVGAIACRVAVTCSIICRSALTHRGTIIHWRAVTAAS